MYGVSLLQRRTGQQPQLGKQRQRGVALRRGGFLWKCSAASGHCFAEALQRARLRSCHQVRTQCVTYPRMPLAVQVMQGYSTTLPNSPLTFQHIARWTSASDS